MSFFHRLCLLFAVALSQGCSAQADLGDNGKVEASSTNEMVERNLIIDQVNAAVERRDFAALNTMEREYRTSRARTPSGLWKLAVFHAGVQYALGDGIERENGCTYRLAPIVAQWKATTPDEPAVIITEAALFNMRAWCARGSGYAGIVSESQWASFRVDSAKAFAVLDAERAKASVDPEFYAVMAQIYRAQGRPRHELDSLVDEGTAREPYYHRTWFRAALSYMPQWGGSHAEFDDFVRLAAKRTRASDKTGFYARVYWATEECGCDIVRQAADWAMMKQSMRDIYERYPVELNAEQFRDISCRAGDADEGLHYIRILTPGATSDADLAARLEGCERMTGSPPPRRS